MQPENVRENRRRVAEHFSLDEPDLQTLHQVHSTDVLTVADDRWSLAGSAQGRRAWSPIAPAWCWACWRQTARRFCWPTTTPGVVGACHAGWKGALGGVADATIAAMEKLGAQARAYPGRSRPLHRPGIV